MKPCPAGRNNYRVKVSKVTMKKPLTNSVTTIFVLALSCSLFHAQSRRQRHQTDRSKIKLIQTASKTCTSNEEMEGCDTDPSAPEPKTGLPGSQMRCSDCVHFGKPIDIQVACYPQDAKVENISGQVQVEVVIDEEGKVIWARAIQGHAKLEHAAVSAACRSRFTPSTLLGGKMKVKTTAVITYLFKLP